MKQNCEVCQKYFIGAPVTHFAGFPERLHTFCSSRCRDLFLRMEDDELEYYWKNKTKQ